jgi:hypothetical protein
MAQQSKKRRIFNSIKQLRLQIARAILRNGSNILALQADIEHAEQVQELCDEYVLRAVFVWLSTKCGSVVYNRPIESEIDRSQFSLCKWFYRTGMFPFADGQGYIDDETFIAACKSAFDADLAPTIELLGSLYEQIVNFPLEIGGNGSVAMPTNIQRKENRRRVGQFYTPPQVVDYCLQVGLGKDSTLLMNGIKANKPFKILDPSCGTGNFLLGAIRLLSFENLSAQERLWFVANCLHAIELDGRAASVARLSLLVAQRDSLYELSDQQGPGETTLAADELLRALRRHIVVQDTLLAAADLMNDSSPPLASYDLVITNPPYISFGARNQPVLPQSQSRFLRAVYPCSAEYKIRVHSIFQDIALRYAREGGLAVLLVPDGFLTGSFYCRLRGLLLERTRLKHFSELRDDTVVDAVVGRWSVACYIRDSKPDKGNYQVDLYSEVEGNGKRAPLNFQLPLSIFVTKDKNRFRLLFDETDKQICLLTDQLMPLNTVMRGHTGMRARHGQSSIVSQHCRGDFWRKGIRSGAQVTAHRVHWDGCWLCVDPSILFKGGFDEHIVEQPKLMVRQTADRLIAGFDDNCLYHLNNVHSFSPLKPDLDLHYISGLFNSSLWLYLYRLRTREDGRALAQIDIETVEMLPLPGDDRKLAPQIATLSRRLSLEREQTGADLLSFIERSIDRLIYEAYRLTPEQVAHVERLVHGVDAIGSCLESLPECGQIMEFCAN